MLEYSKETRQGESEVSNRIRTEDHLVWPKNYRSTWWDNTPGSPGRVNGPWSNNVISGTKRVMSDQVVPGYRSRSAKGEVFNNSMSSQTVLVEPLQSGGCAFQHNNGTNSVHYWGDVEGLFLGPIPVSEPDVLRINTLVAENDFGFKPDIALLTALASTAARAQIGASDYQGLVALGELRDTLRYLKNPFATAIALSDQLKRRIDRLDPSNGKVAASIASLYLEFRYAVRPLVKDVESALLTLAKIGMRPLRHTARSKQTYQKSGSKTGKSVLGGITYTRTTTCTRTTTVRCGFMYEDVVETGLDASWGVRLSDIPTAMWELYPLSFVYDWVANVGSFISAITPVANVRHRASWTTVTDEIDLVLSGSGYKLDQPGWVTTRDGANSIHTRFQTKVRSPGVAFPQIVFKGLDAIENDALKVMDLVGIFGQKLHNAAQVGARKRDFQGDMERRGLRLNARLNRFP